MRTWKSVTSEFGGHALGPISQAEMIQRMAEEIVKLRSKNILLRRQMECAIAELKHMGSVSTLTEIERIGAE